MAGVLVGGVVFMAVPKLGVLLGAACLVWGSVAVAKGVVSPLQLVFGESTKKTLMAVGSALIGIFFLTCSATGFNMASKKEAEQERKAQHDAAEAAKLKAEVEARQARAKDTLSRGTKALADGDVEQAQTLLAEARELDEDVEGADELGKAVKDELHRRALATLPQRLTTIQNLVGQGEWRQAGKECKAAKAIESAFEGLSAACAPVEEQLLRLDRQQAVATALEVANDPDKCETPLALSEAWAALRTIPADDPSFAKAKKATAKLEKCRRKTERVFDKGLREIMITQRETYAGNLDRALLESGFDTRVTIGGQYKDKLKIQWALMGRAMAHKMANEAGILTAAEKIGFKRVTFSDGYFESFYYDLEPQSEAGGGKAVLGEMGLGAPLEL